MSDVSPIYRTVESGSIAVAMLWALLLLNATGWAPAPAASDEQESEPPMLRFGLWAIVVSLLVSWITYFSQHLVLLLEDGSIFFIVPGLLIVLSRIVGDPVLTVLLAIWIARLLDWKTLSAGFRWHPPRWVRAMVALWLAFGAGNLVHSALWARNLLRPLTGGPQDVVVLRTALSGLALVIATAAAYLLIRWPLIEEMASQRGRARGVLVKIGASAALVSGWHWVVSTIATRLLEVDDSTVALRGRLARA